MKTTATPSKSPPRTYRQTARAEAAAAREAQIVESFMALLSDHWLDGVTLEDVARGAGVTVQTVIRKFGGKAGLLQALADRLKVEVTARRQVPVGATAQAIAVLVEDYEVVGDLVMRLLSQEERFSELKPFLDLGRRHHRLWIAEVFAPWLDKSGSASREGVLDALVAATDLYLWKLLRRDFGHEPGHVKSVMLRLVSGVVGAGLETESHGAGGAKKSRRV